MHEIVDQSGEGEDGQRAERIRHMFDRVANRYDLNNALLSLGLDRYWIRRALKVLCLDPRSQVVDLCCGTGALTRAIAQAIPSGQVVGVDFSEGMLAVALARTARDEGGEVRYLRSDVLSVPEPSHRFDAVTIAYGPRNIVDLPALWQEMQRLVKPGGQVLSLELTRPRGVIGFFHQLYLQYVVPWIGGWLSGDRQAYAYLSTTIEKFINPSELAESMRRGGLVDVRIVPLSGGIVTLHHARTPSP